MRRALGRTDLSEKGRPRRSDPTNNEEIRGLQESRTEIVLSPVSRGTNLHVRDPGLTDLSVETEAVNVHSVYWRATGVKERTFHSKWC